MPYLPNVRYDHCTCTQIVSTRAILLRIKTYLSGKSIRCTHHPQWLNAGCLAATRAAISSSLSRSPQRMAETPCPQTWVVVLFQQLGQFLPVLASVRLGEARWRRIQSTKPTEPENNPIQEMNQTKLVTVLTVSTPAESRVSGWVPGCSYG